MELSDDNFTLINVTPNDISPSGHFGVPDTVTRIGNVAFQNATGLIHITFPENLAKIGFAAFSNCTGLRHVIFPEGLTTIWSSAFHGCTGITQITFSENLTDIGHSAFSGCTGITQITFPEGLAEIWNFAFNNCTGLRQVTFPEGLAKIRARAFEDCTNLQFIAINTQSEAEFNRIKALLPRNLQDKVISQVRYEALTIKAAEFRQKALEPLCRIPQINPLLRLSHFKITDERCKLHLIHNASDPLFHINQFVGSNSEPYRAAEDEMKTLSLPLHESYFTAYIERLDSIVSRHVTHQEENLKSTTCTAQAADAEVNASDENDGDFGYRSVKQRP